jgi:hypothetical protein
MRKIAILIIITGFILGLSTIPGFAMSSLARDYLRACCAYDSPFPPRGWDRDDLRSAALEVLDEVESGNYDEWPIDFCLKTLGYTQYPEDLPRILAYKDEWLDTVLRSLKGFPHPKAIDFLVVYLNDKEAVIRELAVSSLGDIDFKKMDEPVKWRNKVIEEVTKTRQKEKVEWLKKDIDRVLEKLEKSQVK